jgi:hypothetical protein
MLADMGDILPADGLLFQGNDIRWVDASPHVIQGLS